MKTKTINPFRISSKLETIEKAVYSSPVTEKLYKNLSKELDQAFNDLTRIKTQTFSLERLEETAVRLYGELENKLVESEIKHIQKTIRSLSSEKAIRRTEKRIRELKEKHLLLSSDRLTIKHAEETLKEAKKTQHFASPPAKQISSDIDPVDVFDLLEVAKQLYEGNKSEARKQFLFLPQYHKDLFEEQINALGALAFDEMYPSVRALVAVANLIANNGDGVPSNADIDQFFSGIDQL